MFLLWYFVVLILSKCKHWRINLWERFLNKQYSASTKFRKIEFTSIPDAFMKFVIKIFENTI